MLLWIVGGFFAQHIHPVFLSKIRLLPPKTRRRAGYRPRCVRVPHSRLSFELRFADLVLPQRERQTEGGAERPSLLITCFFRGLFFSTAMIRAALEKLPSGCSSSTWTAGRLQPVLAPPQNGENLRLSRSSNAEKPIGSFLGRPTPRDCSRFN